MDTIKKQIQKLRTGFQLGSDGRILEWDREYAEYDLAPSYVPPLRISSRRSGQPFENTQVV